MTARRKGYGRLYVRNGVWYMRWRANGRECTRSTGLDAKEPGTQAKAEKMLEEYTEVLRLRDKASRLSVVKRMIETTEQELQDRISGIRRDAPLGRLEEIFRSSAYRIDCSDAQMEAYCRYITALRSMLGDGVRIRDVDARLAEAFARSIAADGSPNTYNKYLNGLGVVWRSVLPVIGAETNPWTAIPRKRLDTNVRRVFTDGEIERVLATAQGEVRTLFALGLYTGLRLGDAVCVGRDDIRDGVIYVRTGKTGAKVALPLHPRLAEAIASAPPDGPLCPELRKAYLSKRKGLIQQRFSRLFKKCGIVTSTKRKSGMARPSCGFHSLRHTFVSKCAEAGVPPQIIQALVGHSSARMTEHYTHLTDAAFLKAFSAIK